MLKESSKKKTTFISDMLVKTKVVMAFRMMKRKIKLYDGGDSLIKILTPLKALEIEAKKGRL
ncbi:MAG: hypothetical protein QXT26_04915 [Thermoproteota archaeon]